SARSSSTPEAPAAPAALAAPAAPAADRASLIRPHSEQNQDCRAPTARRGSSSSATCGASSSAPPGAAVPGSCSRSMAVGPTALTVRPWSTSLGGESGQRSVVMAALLGDEGQQSGVMPENYMHNITCAIPLAHLF